MAQIQYIMHLYENKDMEKENHFLFEMADKKSRTINGKPYLGNMMSMMKK